MNAIRTAMAITPECKGNIFLLNIFFHLLLKPPKNVFVVICIKHIMRFSLRDYGKRKS